SLTEPFQRATESVAKQLEEQAQKIVDGAAREQERLRRLLQDQVGIEQARLGLMRFSAQRMAEFAGAPGSALDFLSVRQLQRPFVAQQEGLTGLRGASALDPAAIGRRFGTVYDSAQVALRRFEGDTPGTAESEQAARELARLQSE